MRRSFMTSPEDEKAWEVEDQYMFGSDMLVCPILYEGMREREVYLPAGKWRNINDNKVYEGGRFVTCRYLLMKFPSLSYRGPLETL